MMVNIQVEVFWVVTLYNVAVWYKHHSHHPKDGGSKVPSEMLSYWNTQPLIQWILGALPWK